MYTRAITLSAGTTPPREFQIFKPGLNDTAKGVFNFDAQAARQVMAAHAKAGAIDLPIDLEHDSLSAERRALRADAGDARGWFQLALRADGSLWATNVRFTPDGERRLRERTQRFISPAFGVDDDGRPTHLINCALVAMPATHGAPALVAASKTARVTARVTPAARAQLYLLAAKRKTTISAVLLSALDTIKCSATVTPTSEAMSALKALLIALDLEGAGKSEVLAAIRSLLGATAEDVIRADPSSQPAPPSDDPLQAAPDAPPLARLSRTFTTSRGAVTLSASEIESCKEAGAKLEAYAENKAIREAARRPVRTANDPLRAVQAARREQARR
jgi:hypothetical protein